MFQPLKRVATRLYSLHFSRETIHAKPYQVKRKCTNCDERSTTYGYHIHLTKRRRAEETRARVGNYLARPVKRQSHPVRRCVLRNLCGSSRRDFVSLVKADKFHSLYY